MSMIATRDVIGFVYGPAHFGGELKKVAAARRPRTNCAGVRRSHLATFALGPPPSFAPELLGASVHPTRVLRGREDRIELVAAAQYFPTHIPIA